MLTSYSKIFLKKGREKSFQLRHHWIFSGAIEKSEGELIDGMPAHICNSKGQIIGLAHYGEKSIAARVLSFSPEQSEQDVIKRSLNKALKHRKSLQLPDSSNNTYRLVHSEGDLLPGLTVDIYKNTIVLQPHSNGMYRLRNEIADMLKELADTSCILLREGRARSADKLAARIIWGTDPTNIITENGIQFEVDLFKGQKTGFFIDQRINRKILGSCSENKSILNLFCYSGGFSLYALVTT
ncbi:MAG TPA: class I SAM-dependent methyltransferase [Oligoflexia bacterium]|mgnify:CR=1 FL=1|nr:class I SAM-dependent methyltransferase [Oligoflexia bacterium]HMP49651.1 class I SAM-dependent methyltransferase [Oligoflexia bacterium]